ncbi:MAG: hypothetical protein OEZ02_03575 [Anaerolineae bacterium]|nr:hypothetical protein [Anaerolineae bacterium]
MTRIDLTDMEIVEETILNSGLVIMGGGICGLGCAGGNICGWWCAP